MTPAIQNILFSRANPGATQQANPMFLSGDPVAPWYSTGIPNVWRTDAPNPINITGGGGNGGNGGGTDFDWSDFLTEDTGADDGNGGLPGSGTEIDGGPNQEVWIDPGETEQPEEPADQEYIQPTTPDPFLGQEGGASGQGDSVSIPTMQDSPLDGSRGRGVGWAPPIFPEDNNTVDPIEPNPSLSDSINNARAWFRQRSDGGFWKDAARAVTDLATDQVLDSEAPMAGGNLAAGAVGGPYAPLAGIAGMIGTEWLGDSIEPYVDQYVADFYGGAPADSANNYFDQMAGDIGQAQTPSYQDPMQAYQDYQQQQSNQPSYPQAVIDSPNLDYNSAPVLPIDTGPDTSGLADQAALQEAANQAASSEAAGYFSDVNTGDIVMDAPQAQGDTSRPINYETYGQPNFFNDFYTGNILGGDFMDIGAEIGSYFNSLSAGSDSGGWDAWDNGWDPWDIDNISGAGAGIVGGGASNNYGFGTGAALPGFNPGG